MKILYNLRNIIKQPKFIRKKRYNIKNVRQQYVIKKENITNVLEENFIKNNKTHNIVENKLSNNVDYNDQSYSSCSYICLFIMMFFYYLSIILTKLKSQINKDR